MHKRKQIKQLIHSINPSIKVKFRRNSNNCDIKRKVVYLDLKATSSLEYINHYNRLQKVYNFRSTVGSTLWVVLHEVGHIMTAHKVKDLDSALEAQADKVHFWVQHSADIKPKHLSKAYALLELERLANEWAFGYAKQYHEQLQALRLELE
jgi:hydroxymethylpyrimidine pyrophosphatase-like HAD family hydrolase